MSGARQSLIRLPQPKTKLFYEIFSDATFQHIIDYLFFSSYQDDRASVFPHGRNLNLLILVVVGASATASLIVGGLIFALASRRRGVAKNVSKLQLSDDIEESGKLEQQQEGYKVLIILLFKVF